MPASDAIPVIVGAAIGAGDQGPWTAVHDTERAAMQAVGSIESYVNLEMVSAIIRPKAR